jgi:hypothetical protein
MADRNSLFADGILEASVTSGVVRVTLAQTGPDGKPFPAGQLIMPLVQLPAFANGLLGLLRQVETRLKEAQAQQQSGAQPTVAAAQANTPQASGERAASPNGEGSAPSVVGAFRFGS